MPRPANRRAVLWKLSLAVSAQSEEALSEALADIFGKPTSTFCDVKTRKSVVEIYLCRPPGKQEWSALQRRIETVRRAGSLKGWRVNSPSDMPNKP